MSNGHLVHRLERFPDKKEVRGSIPRMPTTFSSLLMTTADQPIIAYKTLHEWEGWLAKNHSTSQGIWMRLFKKATKQESITYAEALDGALCYGWIDGQKKSYDQDSWLQKFTPRRSRSVWSKRNTEHIARLTKEDKMKPAGLEAVEAAKADGRWAAAYDSPSNATLPEDFVKELAKNKKAQAFFESLNKSNKYAISYRLQSAKKPETREKRMRIFLEMLAKGEKFN